MGRDKENGYKRVSIRAALAACACIAIITPLEAISATPKEQLPGGTYDSIKKLPDWSGMWTPGRPPADASAEDKQGYARGIFGEGIPLAPKYAKARDERLKAVTGQLGQDKILLSNSGLCIPTGEPMVMGEVSHEYLFSPGRVTLGLENGESRKIWTDGRGHPSEDVSNPSFSGHSIGHWEGDTLVVDTVDIFPGRGNLHGRLRNRQDAHRRAVHARRRQDAYPDGHHRSGSARKAVDLHPLVRPRRPRAGRLRALHARRPGEEGRPPTWAASTSNSIETLETRSEGQHFERGRGRGRYGY